MSSSAEERIVAVVPALTPEHLALSKLYFVIVTNKRVMGLYCGGLLSGIDRFASILEALGWTPVAKYSLAKEILLAPSSVPLDKPMIGEEAEVDIEELEKLLQARKNNFVYSLDEISEVRIEPRRGHDVFYNFTIVAKGKSKKLLVSVRVIRIVEDLFKKVLKEKLKITY
ncbi:MAG: hypothetical protein QW701_04365 [Candidatus Nezhaarchaeales archaeon]